MRGLWSLRRPQRPLPRLPQPQPRLGSPPSGLTVDVLAVFVITYLVIRLGAVYLVWLSRPQPNPRKDRRRG